MTDPPAASNLHYDQDPRIFELFLDSSMKYSSGLYRTPGDSLEKAQRQKLDFIAENLGATPQSTILDVGCGWGSLVVHLAQEVGCRVVGVTPAPAQARYVRRRLERAGAAERAEILVSPFERLEFRDRSFDGVSFVGSIVHLPDKAGALAGCFSACRPGAAVYLSETCFRSRKIQEKFDQRPGTQFIRDEIFGQGELIPLSQYISYFEQAGFSLAGLHDLSRDYHRTIEQWRENARRNREALEAIEPGILDRLERYFDVANAGWGYTSKQYAIVARRRR